MQYQVGARTINAKLFAPARHLLLYYDSNSSWVDV